MESSLAFGMRVRADWRDARTGSITDIRAFVPETPSPQVTPDPSDLESPVVTSDLELHYTYEPGRLLSGFLRALGQHRVEGGRCPRCAAVYVPPRPRCPACGGGPMTPVPVADRGVVVSHVVVHVPPYGSSASVPFAWAYIRLDGTDVTFPHLLGDVPLGQVHAGLRVRAVWVPSADLAPTWASIRYFGPDR